MNTVSFPCLRCGTGYIQTAIFEITVRICLFYTLEVVFTSVGIIV